LKMGKRIVFLIAALICVTDPAWSAGGTAEGVRTPVRVAFVDNFSPSFYITTYAPTIQYLKEKFPEYQFESLEFASTDAMWRSSEHFDFVVSSSGAFAKMRMQMGLDEVVMRKPVSVNKASESVSGVMLVLDSRSDLQTIGDLRGRVMVAEHNRTFGGYVALLDEIARKGYDPERFFAEERFTEYQYPDSISLLTLGRADVAFLSSCKWEDLIRRGRVKKDTLRVINERTLPGERCARSTVKLPGEIFATTSSVAPEVAKNIAIALLQMPRDDRDWEWVLATDIMGVYDVLERLKLGPYSYLRDRTPAVLFKRYRMQITLGVLLAVFIAVLALLHIYRTNDLVRRKTQELTETIQEKESLIGQVNRTQQYLHLLERTNLVSQLSSMFAHEIKQPVTNIINYAAGIRMLADMGRGGEPETRAALNAIADQAQRVADIVERVRAYAKGRPTEMSLCRLSEIIDRLVENFRLGQSSRAKIVKSVPRDIVISADPVALELLFLNLLRNADQALRNVRAPVIRVSAASCTGYVRVSVSDNGPGVPEHLIGRLGQPGAVPEPSGLGLGIAIAVGIAEKHKGHLEFQNRPEGGFVATVSLPAVSQERPAPAGEPVSRMKQPEEFRVS